MLKFLNSLFKREGANQDHSAVMNAIGEILDEAGSDADQMKSELHPLTATEQWLDDWGSWFGIVRTPAETDNDYRVRVLDVMSKKATIPAIEDAVKRILGQDTIVKVYEPFNEMRYFNRSTFSGEGRYEDGTYYRIGVVDVQISKPINDEVKNLINLITAAGVSARFTYVYSSMSGSSYVDCSDNTEPTYNYMSISSSVVSDQVDNNYSGSDEFVVFSGGRVIWETTIQEPIN